jgi:hypothetical protein
MERIPRHGRVLTDRDIRSVTWAGVKMMLVVGRSRSDSPAAAQIVLIVSELVCTNLNFCNSKIG